MRYKVGDRVIDRNGRFKVSTGVVTQRWNRYHINDAQPTYHVLLDKPEDRSSMFWEDELLPDVLRSLVPEHDVFRVGHMVTLREPKPGWPIPLGKIVLMTNGRAHIDNAAGFSSHVELEDLALYEVRKRRPRVAKAPRGKS